MKIVDIARNYIGETELKGNSGFKHAEFQKKLADDGWLIGQSWCCYFMEMIFEEAYPEFEKELDRLFSGSVSITQRNFIKAGYAHSLMPEVGNLCIYRHYINGVIQPQGHISTVTEVHSKVAWSEVSGNTNRAGAREGTTVLEKEKFFVYPLTGLRVETFIKFPKV